MRRIMLCASLAALALLPAVILAAEDDEQPEPAAIPRTQSKAEAALRAAMSPPPVEPTPEPPAPEPEPANADVQLGLAALARLRAEAGRSIQPDFAHVNDPENLRALFRRIRELIRAGQYARANQLCASLLPDENRLKLGLREDVAPNEVRRILDLEKRSRPARSDELYTLFQPDPTASEVRLYRATTEELIASPRDTAARNVFPKPSHKTAQTLLRPHVTWYIGELCQPGADQGLRYHLIFFDGKRWTMLGPIWSK